MSNDLDRLGAAVRRFAENRDWTQFHRPRSLLLAIAGEVGELAEVIQWLPDDEVERSLDDLRPRLADEAADVLIYLIRFAEVCGIDLLSEAYAKIERNEDRYPADAVRGRAVKYTELEGGPA
jgi:NTP pyrophosphatase (non-canonical NTP hydrolase)